MMVPQPVSFQMTCEVIMERNQSLLNKKLILSPPMEARASFTIPPSVVNRVYVNPATTTHDIKCGI
ncbi:hypothetical protein D3C85_1812790 [compost metagenome]